MIYINIQDGHEVELTRKGIASSISIFPGQYVYRLKRQISKTITSYFTLLESEFLSEYRVKSEEDVKTILFLNSARNEININRIY